jgi:hypothetical protein
MALGLTYPLTEMSTGNLPGGKGQSALKADNVISVSEPIIWKNVGASTFHNLIALHGLSQG